jgi:hypothetical protein
MGTYWHLLHSNHHVNAGIKTITIKVKNIANQQKSGDLTLYRLEIMEILITNLEGI